MAKTHPLDETFNMDTDDNIAEILGANVKIPTDPSLRTVVSLALEQYKHLIEESVVMEPEDQLKHIEMAKEYLRIAKDAMRDESDLEIKFIRASGSKKLPPSSTDTSNGENNPDRLEDRSSVYEQISNMKKQKTRQRS